MARHPRPKMKIRNKKRRHPTWRMTPEEKKLWYWINVELLKMYMEEFEKQVLWGDGQGFDGDSSTSFNGAGALLKGIYNDDNHPCDNVRSI